VPQPSESPAAIQPSILVHAGGSLQALGRTKASRIFSTISNDNGLTWAPLSLLELPNPNSGIDAVTLKDGRHVLIYNHTTKDRSPLNVAISKDGRAWEAAMVLEDKPGEYSYPAVIQTRDGFLHFTYTWKRSLAKHVVVDPSKLTLTPMVNGEWPAGR
jgi:predicted neuraminidase